MSAWPEEVGRALLALGVPWLPGMLSHGGMRVGGEIHGADGVAWRVSQPHSADWPDLRDDATRGAVRGWLSARVGEPLEQRWSEPRRRDWRWGTEVHRVSHDETGDHEAGADWREAEARALLALAREVLS